MAYTFSRFIAAAVVSLVAAGGTAAGGTDAAPSSSRPALLQLLPRNVFGPADVEALVRVPRHPENRRLRVVIDSERYYRSTEIQLDGDESPEMHAVRWRSVPPGAYVVEVSLYGYKRNPDHQVRMEYLIH
jgi:hypothetical protein